MKGKFGESGSNCQNKTNHCKAIAIGASILFTVKALYK